MTLQLIIELISAAIGTVAFSLLFGVPKQRYADCGFTGMAGWLMYRLTEPMSATFAVFFAALLIVFLSRMLAVRHQCPVTVFLISGIFPLVPGAQIYWAAYYLVTGQYSSALSSGFAALKVIIAMVLGIVFMFEVPNKFFLLFRKRNG